MNRRVHQRASPSADDGADGADDETVGAMSGDPGEQRAQALGADAHLGAVDTDLVEDERHPPAATPGDLQDRVLRVGNRVLSTNEYDVRTWKRLAGRRDSAGRSEGR